MRCWKQLRYVRLLPRERKTHEAWYDQGHFLENARLKPVPKEGSWFEESIFRTIQCSKEKKLHGRRQCPWYGVGGWGRGGKYSFLKVWSHHNSVCDLGPLFFLPGTQLPYHRMVRWHPSRAFRLFVVAALNSGNHFSDNNVQGIPLCKTDAGGMDLVLREWRVLSAPSLTQPPLHLFTDTLKVSLENSRMS